VVLPVWPAEPWCRPSDLCCVGGMYQERIRSNPNWCEEYPQHDTVFIETDGGQGGMQGMVIGHVQLFFSFATDRKRFHVPSLSHLSGLYQGMSQMRTPECG